MKKRIFPKLTAMMLTVLMLANLVLVALPFSVVAADEYSVWDGTADTSWYDPTSENKVYEIDSAAELAGLAKLTKEGAVKEPGYFEGYTFYITKNIDLANIEWMPIGDNNARSFAGTLEGKLNGVAGTSVIIKNMKISSGGNIGLVGTQGAGGVKNITLVNASITTTGNTAGSFVGYAKSSAGPYENLVSDAIITTTGAQWVGGIVAYTNSGSNVTFKNCVYTGTISTTAKYVGGITGVLTAKQHSFINCQVDGVIDAKNTQTGTFVGRVNCGTDSSVTFENCLNTGVSHNTYATAGNKAISWIGLVGNNNSTITLNFKNCYSAADVSFAAANDNNTANVYYISIDGATATTLSCTDDQTLKAYKAHSVDADGTIPSGFDSGLWTARTGMYPIHTLAKDVASTTYASADLDWFIPGTAQYTISTNSELLGLAKWSQVLYRTAGSYAITVKVNNMADIAAAKALIHKNFADSVSFVVDLGASSIDADILGVKFQTTKGTTSASTSTNLRIVTTVNNITDYKEAGFVITVNGKTSTLSTTKAYKQLCVSSSDNTVDYADPTVFSADSTYFIAYSLYNIPQADFGTKITVRPYVVLQDGTTVTGAAVSGTISSLFD